MDENYEDLYIAIWKKAIQDEIAKAVKAIYGHAFWNSYSYYRRNTLDPLDEKSKEVKKAKKNIREKAKSLCAEKLEQRIKVLVMQEAKSWPENSYQVNSDAECKEILAELKKEALAYARERFGEISGQKLREVE